ncbi:hypothetical protein (nucleomorph) [Guillardia theta]|uniref:Uncharacterized protein n=1 Tax=Guillardia theta TaxID=55529 RepID=Q98S61_GUITH|nr:hypothetical protein GTHECHR3077 [Guillardia theta]AAK39721.1 hypothetical protein [Guillardia theta]
MCKIMKYSIKGIPKKYSYWIKYVYGIQPIINRRFKKENCLTNSDLFKSYYITKLKKFIKYKKMLKNNKFNYYKNILSSFKFHDINFSKISFHRLFFFSEAIKFLIGIFPIFIIIRLQDTMTNFLNISKKKEKYFNYLFNFISQKFESVYVINFNSFFFVKIFFRKKKFFFIYLKFTSFNRNHINFIKTSVGFYLQILTNIYNKLHKQKNMKKININGKIELMFEINFFDKLRKSIKTKEFKNTIFHFNERNLLFIKFEEIGISINAWLNLIKQSVSLHFRQKFILGKKKIYYLDKNYFIQIPIFSLARNYFNQFQDSSNYNFLIFRSFNYKFSILSSNIFLNLFLTTNRIDLDLPIISKHEIQSFRCYPKKKKIISFLSKTSKIKMFGSDNTLSFIEKTFSINNRNNLAICLFLFV